MIEIALAIGVIGFALVAIIGLLPAGLNSQKSNREDTIVSQDAPYFINAIRNGEQRTTNNFLTQYVESITISNVNGGGETTYGNPLLGTTGNGAITLVNDSNIIGLLTTPEFDPRLTLGVTNQVTAIVRAMTGSAIDQGGSNAATAFRYALTVEVVPWTIPTNPPTSSDSGQFLYESNLNYQATIQAAYLTNSLHEVRLKFNWPVIETGTTNIIGPNTQTYRTMVSGFLNLTNFGAATCWFFEPNAYSINYLNGNL
jgi:hypothetical protein